MWNLLKHSAPEWITRFGRDPFTLLIIVLAGLGTAHVLVRTATYGAAVTQDSIAFLSTALNFLAGEGWRDFKGNSTVEWPPLFPLLLAALGWVGIDPLEAGRLINATTFGLTILAAGGWLRSNLRSQWLTLAATATLAASLPLSRWASHFMTDALFVLFTLLALIQLAAFLSQRTAAPLWWAAVFTALAAITRYSGVVLVGTGVLILLPLARRRQTLVFGAISSVPLLAVLAHNWAVTGDLTLAAGYRKELSGQSLSDSLSRVADVFRGWVIPPNAPDGLAYLLWIATGLVVLAAGAVVVLAGRGLGMGGKSPSFGLGPALPFGGFAAIYLVFTVVIVPLVVPVEFPVRYLLPIYVPLLLTAVFLLDRFLSIEATGRMAAVRYAVAALVLLATLAHLCCSAHENLRLTARAYVVGYEEDWMFNTARSQHSATLTYLRDNPIAGRIYTNDRYSAWFAERTAAPGKHQQILGRKIPGKRRWTEIEAGAHIVRFERVYDRTHFSRSGLDLRLLPGMETVAELADGLVLRRTAYEPLDKKRHHARKQRYVDQLIQQADEQVVRAGWNVYRTGRTLIYRKEPCVPADIQAKFILHLVPADPADLPVHRQQYDSDNLDFYFDWLGFRLGDQCIAIVRLPSYAIDRIHIGQWIAEEDRTLWEAEFPPR